jgi:hypothetical protein
MAKPTFASVTEELCTCGFLQEEADNPSSPIVYDSQLNEYHFEYPSPCADGERGPDKAMLMIYHCPFCGGAAPDSKRDLLFAVIPVEEERRLYQLFHGIKTLNDAIQVLGPPDQDNPHGVKQTKPERAGTAPTVAYFRTLWYSRLSTVAEVFVEDYGSDGVHFRLQGKHIAPPAKEGGI